MIIIGRAGSETGFKELQIFKRSIQSASLCIYAFASGIRLQTVYSGALTGKFKNALHYCDCSAPLSQHPENVFKAADNFSCFKNQRGLICWYQFCFMGFRLTSRC